MGLEEVPSEQELENARTLVSRGNDSSWGYRDTPVYATWGDKDVWEYWQARTLLAEYEAYVARSMLSDRVQENDLGARLFRLGVRAGIEAASKMVHKTYGTEGSTVLVSNDIKDIDLDSVPLPKELDTRNDATKKFLQTMEKELSYEHWKEGERYALGLSLKWFKEAFLPI